MTQQLPTHTEAYIFVERQRINAMPQSELIKHARQLATNLYQQQARFKHVMAVTQGITTPPEMRDGLFVLPPEKEIAFVHHLRSLDKMRFPDLQAHTIMMMTTITTTEHQFRQVMGGWGKPSEPFTIPTDPDRYNEEPQ
jgi:hypothetical protein